MEPEGRWWDVCSSREGKIQPPSNIGSITTSPIAFLQAYNALQQRELVHSRKRRCRPSSADPWVCILINNGFELFPCLCWFWLRHQSACSDTDFVWGFCCSVYLHKLTAWSQHLNLWINGFWHTVAQCLLVKGVHFEAQLWYFIRILTLVIILVCNNKVFRPNM